MIDYEQEYLLNRQDLTLCSLTEEQSEKLFECFAKMELDEDKLETELEFI